MRKVPPRRGRAIPPRAGGVYSPVAMEIEDLDAAGTARCLLWRDPPSGLTAVLVIDDLTLGPGAGGVRTRAYPGLAAAVAEASALARAMTRKCALAGLAAGGAKAVVLDHPGLDRPAAFRALGRLVAELGGLFRTAGDLGTTAADLAAMAETCPYVHPEEGGLTEAVARGLVGCARACARARGRDLAGLPARFFRRVAKVIDVPWMMSTLEDFRIDGVEGSRPPGYPLIAGFLAHVHRAACRDRDLARHFLRAMHMLESPAVFLRPDLFARAMLRGGLPAAGPQPVPAAPA